MDLAPGMDSPMDTGSVAGENETNPLARILSPHSPLLLQPPSFFTAVGSVVANGHSEGVEEDEDVGGSKRERYIII